jgi:hypothetical protein
MSPGDQTDLEWTVDDQRRVDDFEQQILDVAAQVEGGHPDALVLGFAQALGTLMRRRLQADPTRLKFYALTLRGLVDYVIPTNGTGAPTGARPN